MKSIIFATTLAAIAATIDLTSETDAELEAERSSPLVEMNVYEGDDCCDDDGDGDGGDDNEVCYDYDYSQCVLPD